MRLRLSEATPAVRSNALRKSTGASSDRLHQLLLALCERTRFGHSIEQFELLQTHISYILLTGPYAYKFKKPVELGFLDFSTLAKRKYFLEEELRLNRRLADSLYVDVVPITGSDEKPMIGGTRHVLEYALKMVQFPQQAQLDRVLERGALTTDHIDEMARQIAAFHQVIPEVDTSDPFGTPQQIRKPILANFEQLSSLDDRDLRHTLHRLRAWAIAQAETLEEVFMNRRREGRIRECHGDIHLSNMALLDKHVVIFDCIEFSEALRWIDVMSEVAFLLMDLDFRQRSDLAHRFLSRYLEHMGDYPGLLVLDFYRVYRSLVRAKVADIERQQTMDAIARKAARQRLKRHIALAKHYTESVRETPLLIAHGLSGSGKTTITEQLVERLGAIRVRSDVERKRLQGLSPQARSGSRIGGDLYHADMTELTYTRLRELAGQILSCRYPVIVDATFLKKEHRDAFCDLARERQVPFQILDFQASPATLRSRIERRQSEQKDASEAGLQVLGYQLENHEPIDDVERDYTTILNSERELDLDAIVSLKPCPNS